MTSGLDLRKRGARRPGKAKDSYYSGLGPLTAVDGTAPGEVKISTDVQFALHHLYETSPSIQAARAILLGQLLSSGLAVRRGGNHVELTDSFAKFLEDKWLVFARDVIDSFLQFGFVVVSLEPDDPPPFSNRRRQATESKESDVGIMGDAAAARARKAPIQTDRALSAKAAAELQEQTENLVPIVPDIGTYDLSFLRVGESSYKRKYRIFSTSADMVYREDLNSEVFLRSPPDGVGNISSPVATVFQSASFISALEELALQAEVVRARSQIVTQPVQRTTHNNNLDPQNLFFDSESRAIQSSSTAEEDVQQAQSLAFAAKMMAYVNKVATTNPNVTVPGASAAAPSHVPPEVPPRLFAVPDKQQVVPNLKAPEARSDLVELIRVVNDHSEFLLAHSPRIPAHCPRCRGSRGVARSPRQRRV